MYGSFETEDLFRSESSSPEWFFLFDPPNPPNHPTPYPLDLPQNTNFVNFGPIWRKIGVEVINGEQSSKLEKVSWSDHQNPPYPYPIPPNPSQSTYFADFGPIWMKLGV